MGSYLSTIIWNCAAGICAETQSVIVSALMPAVPKYKTIFHSRSLNKINLFSTPSREEYIPEKLISFKNDTFNHFVRLSNDITDGEKWNIYVTL